MGEFEKGFIAGFLLNYRKEDNNDDKESSGTWSYPSDWLKLPEPAGNQITVLVSAPYGGKYYEHGIKINCTKPVHINWGDGSSIDINSTGEINKSHTYTKDTGHIARNCPNLTEEKEYCEQWIITITFEANGDDGSDYIKYLAYNTYMDTYAVKVGHIGYFCNTHSEKLIDNGHSMYYLKICNGSNFKLQYCYELRKLEFPKNITKLDAYALNGCYSLFDVDLSNIIELGESALNGCYLLDASGKMPKLTTIGNRAFANSRLADLDFPCLEEIGEYTFQNCLSLKTITIPEKITSISKYCFYGCNNLNKVILQNATNINAYAFASCTRLLKIEGDKITTIANNVFSSCRSLKTVYLPCCNSIDKNAFQSCYSLCDVTLQSGCEFSVNTTTSDPFYGCYSLDYIKYVKEDTGSTEQSIT